MVSTIPALSAFFSFENAYVFDPGNETMLASAVISLAVDLAKGKPRVALLEYEDALLPYMQVVNAARNRKLQSSVADTIMEEAAIKRMQTECWEEAECSGKCEKRWTELSLSEPIRNKY